MNDATATISYVINTRELPPGKPFTVGGFGSDPTAAGTLDNDDWWIGADCATYEEAFATYTDFSQKYPSYWILIVGPTGPDKARGFMQMLEPMEGAAEPVDADDDGWRREMAMESGMAFGADGYNDAMGF